MRKIIVPVIVVFLALLNTAYSASIPEDSVVAVLKLLDNTLANRKNFEIQDRKEIDSLLNDYRHSQDANQQYNTLRSLFNLYRTFKIDSALIIAENRLEAARKIGDRSKIISASLNLADGYVKSGNSELAIVTLDNLDEGEMASHQLKYRNSIYKNAYTTKAETALLPSERIEAIEKLKYYTSKEIEEAQKDSRTYLAVQAERLREAGMKNEAVAKMEELNRKFDISDNASLLYETGLTYYQAGRIPEAIYYLSKAAVRDISLGSKEYKALILLASVMSASGDVDHAFAYINCALEDAMFSKAHIRSDEIMKIVPNIYQAYSEKEREVKQRTAWFTSVIGITNLLLIVLLVLFIRDQKIKKRMIREIRSFNENLESQNRKLEASDQTKLEHLKEFMKAYSMHVSKLKSFRKNILRLLKTSQYSKAIQKVREEDDEAADKDTFPEMFDAVFLSLYPDFIPQLNKYLKTPLEEADNARMAPEFRIAALMKLGITSTAEISEMFQYSAQSVYNLRSTLRSMLNVSWEDFEEAMKKLQ